MRYDLLIKMKDLLHFDGSFVSYTGYILVLVSIIFAFSSWIRNRHYRRIPGPKGNFLLGNTLDFSVSADHHALLLKWSKEHGGVFKYYVLFGGYRVHVTDPDIAKHVIVSNSKNYRRQDVLKKMLPDLGNGLITANGRAHAVQRKQLNPFFSLSRVKQFLPVFVKKANELVHFWTNEISCKESMSIECDVLEKLTHLTLDVIGLSAFGYSFNCILGGHSEESKATDTILRTCFDLQDRSVKELFPLLKLIKSKTVKEFQKAEKCFRTLLEKIIQQRKNELEKATEKQKIKEDLLEILFEMEDENHNRITNEDIFHQVFTFMIAGHETTSLTATWTLFLLAKHPCYQEKVRKEIHDILQRSDSEITWQDLDNMKYLDKCIKEAMRLYPVAITTDRTAIRGDKLGDYDIPPDTHVMVGIGTLHRLETYWKNPDEFDPNRFDMQDEATTPKSQYHFLPFSRGPRMCIGYRFAVAELKVTLAKILKTFTFKLSANQNYELKSISTLTLKPFPPPILKIGLAEGEV